jgi:hypothetical protein
MPSICPVSGPGVNRSLARRDFSPGVLEDARRSFGGPIIFFWWPGTALARLLS